TRGDRHAPGAGGVHAVGAAADPSSPASRHVNMAYISHCDMAGGGVAGRNARTDTLTAADYRTLAELRYLLRRFASFSEAAPRGPALTSQQHQALLAIKGSPGRERLAVGELAERLQLRHHSAVGL